MEYMKDGVVITPEFSVSVQAKQCKTALHPNYLADRVLKHTGLIINDRGSVSVQWDRIDGQPCPNHIVMTATVHTEELAIAVARYTMDALTRAGWQVLPQEVDGGVV